MIGVFDSGVGGLYALRELRRLCPRADLVYFADEANLPYGGRAHTDLLRLSARAVSLLRGEGAQAIIAACGTVSSTVIDRLATDCPLPLFGAAIPLAEGVVRALKGKAAPRLLLLATEGTVRAGKIAAHVAAALPDAQIDAVATPALVALAEELCPETAQKTKEEVARLLSPLAPAKYDLIALGCTHFSALADSVRAALGGIPTLDGATLAARAAARAIPKARQGESGRVRLFTSGDEGAFARAAARILGERFPVFGVK